ncbi:polyisoprenoid-binding protein [Fulvitalea axinellae]|uniref:Polyisoprenoid-binding protein n=1 Tax=Fulvitalea axinellae TaxID=1182444 RepID=A0AAU9C713_9BACT|nr:polyisoprenoid-binding protein [Fulvitalea axinellae]
MKKIALSLVFVLAFAVSKAQTFSVNSNDSKVEWVGKKITGSSHSGLIQIKSGSVEFKKNKPVGGEFVIDMASITVTDIKDKTKNGYLVGHLKNSDFFDVEKFPTATLKIKKFASAGDGTYKVTGDLTIKSITKPITFEAKVDKKSATASIDVDRAEYNVRYGSGSFFDNLGDKAINDVFELKVNLAISGSSL